MQIAVYPVDHIGLTTYFSSSHKAIDLGWRKNPSPPIYAAADGEVVGVGKGSDGGLYVFIRHEDLYGLENKTCYTRYYHLAAYNVKAGDKVKRYDKIGIMGTTGYSTGIHLHLDLSAYPKGHRSFPSDFRSYAVDPQKYLYRQSFQTVSEDSKNVMNIESVNIKEPEKEEPKPETAAKHYAGMPVMLSRAPLYASGDSKNAAGYVSGRYYCYDGKVFGGRVRITNSLKNLGLPNGVTGYVDLSLIAPEQNKKQYTVKKGDSLWAIAKANSAALADLIGANPQIKNPSLIYPGQVINLP